VSAATALAAPERGEQCVPEGEVCNATGHVSAQVFGISALEGEAQRRTFNAGIQSINEIWFAASGTSSNGDATYLAFVSADMEYVWGDHHMLYGALFFTNNSSFTNDLAGDFQIISNIDNTQAIRPAEMWYQWRASKDVLSLKAGILDLNTTFDVIDTAALFIHSSHGIGAEFANSGANGPSIFPATTWGVEAIAQPTQTLDLRIALYDAVAQNPDRPRQLNLGLGGGALIVSEVNFSGIDKLRLGVGAWAYTQTPVQPGQVNAGGGNWGLYAIAETQTAGPVQGWLRYGLANNTRANPVDWYVGTGLVVTHEGLTGGDRFGMAVAIASPSDDRAAEEIALEWTYALSPIEAISIQPNLQYIIAPNFARERSAVLAFGLRLEFGARLH